MRGAAPSIVCPRCEQAAPPANTVGQFTTCTKCGMTFNAAPRERLFSFRKRKHDPAPVREEVDRPIVDEVVVEKPQRKPGHLSGLQIIGILVAIFTIAWIKVEYFPSDEQREQQHEIEMIQKEARQRAKDAEWRAQRAAQLQTDVETKIRDINVALDKALADSPHESCREAAKLFAHPWQCEGAGRKELDETFFLVRFVMARGEQDLEARCRDAVATIQTQTKRIGCI